MHKNFIEHKNFLKIYEYNRLYRSEHKRHRWALNFQLVILIACLAIALINYHFDNQFINDLYLDQINRIYAILVALLTAILIGITPIDRDNQLTKQQYDYLTVTFKQDYVSVLMYTLMLYLLGIIINVLYAVFFQYFINQPLDIVFWITHLFLLLNSLFFTAYSVDELADIVKNAK